MPARPRPHREPARPFDNQALALSVFASLSGAILSSALGAGELASLVCAAIAPALTALVMHPGPHRRRRLALIVALLALLHTVESALARVLGRPVAARTPRAGSLRLAGLTACIAFAISVVALTAPEIVLGEAIASDRRLTLFPVDEETRRGPAPDATPTPTATTPPAAKATPKPKPTPRPTATATPTPDSHSPDPTGPPPPDRTAPELELPADVSARATDHRGVVVRYTATAGEGIASCRPPSGTRFPIGTTTVRCSAQDRAGNVARGSFEVHVTAPPPVTPPPAVPAPQPLEPWVPGEPEVPGVPEAPVLPQIPEAPEHRAELTPEPEPQKPESPVFTGPRTIIVDTTAPKGTRVRYRPPPAIDSNGRPARVRCSPPTVAAGSRAQVLCTATDHAGSSAQATFTVWIRIVDLG